MQTFIQKDYQTILQNKTMKIKHIIFLTIFCCLCSSCSKSDDSEGRSVTDSRPVVVALFTPFGLGDVTREDVICKGIINAAQQKGLKTIILPPQYYRESGYNSLLSTIKSLSSADAPHLYFIVSGYDRYMNDIIDALKQDKNGQLLVEGPSTGAAEIHNITLSPYGASYVAGTLAARMYPDEEQAIDILYDSSDYGMRETALGFADGCNSIRTAPPYMMDYFDPDDDEGFYFSYGGTYGLYEFNSFTNFLLPCHKNYYRTLVTCPEMAQTFHFLGIDSDLSSYSHMVPFSSVRHFDKAIEHCITQWLSPEGLPHSQWYGLGSEYVELTVSPGYEYLQPYADAVFNEAKEKETERNKNAL